MVRRRKTLRFQQVAQYCRRCACVSRKAIQFSGQVSDRVMAGQAVGRRRGWLSAAFGCGRAPVRSHQNEQEQHAGQAETSDRRSTGLRRRGLWTVDVCIHSRTRSCHSPCCIFIPLLASADNTGAPRFVSRFWSGGGTWKGNGGTEQIKRNPASLSAGGVYPKLLPSNRSGLSATF